MQEFNLTIKISNEKIMSVNDYSSQILEKIDVNHKEVVFLYDMLNQKEDAIKETVYEFDSEKNKLQEMMENTELLLKQIKGLDNRENITTVSSEKLENRQAIRIMESVKVIENHLETEQESDAITSQQKEKILQLYKQGKSVLDISKALKRGQGEVKLIIGLYTT